MSRIDRSTARRTSRATTSSKDPRGGGLPDSGPSARGARGEGGPVGAIGEIAGSAGPLGTSKTRNLIDADQANQVRASPREYARNAMQSARACVPDEFRDGLTFCGRPTPKSQIWWSYDPETGRVSTWISGLATCKLSWVCPSCGSSHGYASQVMLDRSMRGWTCLGPDHEFALMTLTVRHDAGRPLAESLSGLLRAFTILMNSKTLRRLKKMGVIFGFYRALEVTYGTKFAWHPHLHVLVLTTDLAALKREWRTEKDEDGVSHGIKVEWGKALNKASEELGFDRKLGAMQRHQDLRVATVDDAGRLAGYLTKDGTKWSAAAEMTRLDVKEGRVENLGPIQLLVAAGNGDLRALARWHEFVRATKGVHHLEASYYDFKTRTRITEYLHDVLERFEFRDENAAIGVGAKDDPRVVANREVLDARDEAFEALPSDQRWAYGRRRRDAEQAERSMQPVMRPVASFERSEELSGKDGRVTLTELYRDPRPLYDLMHAIESVRDVKDVRGVARQVALELGLPISTEERPVRGHRGIDEERVDYRQRRADLETRLTDKGLDGDEIEQRLDAFDEKNKPFDSSRYMRHVRQIERGKALSAVRNAFTGAMRTKGRSQEEIERFVGTFRANNSDENMFA